MKRRKGTKKKSEVGLNWPCSDVRAGQDRCKRKISPRYEMHSFCYGACGGPLEPMRSLRRTLKKHNLSRCGPERTMVKMW